MPDDRLESYRQTIRSLSDRLVEAQRPLRILDAIKWDASIQHAFFAAGCREQPPVDRAYYEARPLGFDPAAKRQQFHELERDTSRLLGQFSPVGTILRRMCREYRAVVRMLEMRGTAEFAALSQELYGSPSDAFHAGDPTMEDLGRLLGSTLQNIDRGLHLPLDERTIGGEEAVRILQERLDRVFPPSARPVRVMLSDGIVSDAAAGTDYLKIRKEARFSERELQVLELHEGYVHLGTTLNGLNQPVCTFLSKGPPSSTVTQEGLAILMEIIGFASHAQRVRRLTNRLRATRLAESGATFLDVYRFFLEQGLEPAESYGQSSRIFRGCNATAGAFTKDISYTKGFILVYNYILLAVRRGMLDRIPLLFCGKTTLEDMRTIARLVEEGLVEPPRFLPPQFADLNALTAWMCYSDFLNRLDHERIEADYVNLL